MIKALTKLIAGDDYDLGPWVEAKTPMIPAKKTSEGLREVAGILSPFIPTWMLELQFLQKQKTAYVIAEYRSQKNRP